MAATLDQLGQTAEVSSTVFNRMIPIMFIDTKKYATLAGLTVEKFTALLNEDANEAFIRFMEGLKGNGSGKEESTEERRLNALEMWFMAVWNSHVENMHMAFCDSSNMLVSLIWWLYSLKTIL